MIRARLFFVLFVAVLAAPVSGYGAKMVTGTASTREDVAVLTNNSSYCSAVLVAPEWILTSSRCVTQLNGIVIAVFRHSPPGQEDYQVFPAGDSIELVPLEGESTPDEIGVLLRLDRPRPSRPALLDSRTIPQEQVIPGLFVGYGYLSETVSGGAQQHATDMSPIRNFSMISTTPDTFPQGCYGDMGGPLFDRTTGALVGIMSGSLGEGTVCRAQTLFLPMDRLREAIDFYAPDVPVCEFDDACAIVLLSDSFEGPPGP